MKNTAIALLAVTLGYGLAAAQQPGIQMGQETKKEMKTEKKNGNKAKMSICKGTVEAVDTAAGKITVKEHNGAVMIMSVGADTKIMKDGKPASISDIMIGEMAHIRYEGKMDNPIVKSVMIKTVHMKKGKMDKKTGTKNN